MIGRRDFNMRQILPRDYQMELVERALYHNTIISLGKNISKIFVAIQLIKEYSHRLLKSNEKAIVLVNSVSSVELRANQIEFHSSLNVLRIYNILDVDLGKQIRKHQILVTSAQIFLDMLNKKIFDLDKAALLILDECHHCLLRSHPYRHIMDFYRNLSNEKPRLLGLTDSLLNKRVPPPIIESMANKLERIMLSDIETASDLAVTCKYVVKPKQFVICTKDDGTNEKFVVDTLNQLRGFVERNGDFHTESLDVDPRRPILEAINRAFATLQQLGSWCALKGCILWQKKLAKLIEEPILGPRQRCLLRIAETSFRICSKVLSHKVSGVNSLAKLIADSQRRAFISDRMQKLLEILRDYSPSKRAQLGFREPLSALIFVKERFIAFMINTLLKAIVKWEPQEFGHLKVDFLVGHNNPAHPREEEERKLANKKQEQTLQKFRNGQLNVLVTTNVLEEGVDIRNCNLVIRFDPATDFRSHVQSSGRVRRENGAVYILIEERNRANLMEELENYTKIEQFILGRYRSGNEILKEDDSPKSNIDELLPPYSVESTSGRAQVTLSGAIPLVNRYCSKLPSDVFTRLVPYYRIKQQLEDGQIHFSAELLLPINSPLKECVRWPEEEDGSCIRLKELSASKSLTLMAAALKTCKRLHKRKELNDQLMPTGKETVTNLLGELDEDEEYLPYLLNKIGSSKRRRLYDRKMSKSLVKTLPVLESECLVYLIEMKLIKPISEENNPKKRKIIDPYETNSAFGFLSCRELPSVPGFPIFQRQGEMMVQIRRVNSTLRLTQELFQLIGLFHEHIFEDILRIARGGVAFAPAHSPFPLLIVPLKRAGPNDLDYELDISHLRWDIRDPPRVPSEETRKKFKFDETLFTNSVVMPWYRSDEQCSYYYVAEICRDQNPSSVFPDTKFTSFNEYFMAKYQLQIYDQDQCLLDVDHTSARMNLLLPRVSSGKSVRRPLDPSQKQILVPELLHIHPLSAHLWTMIIALPSVLYRINSLLLADEFRVKVMEDALKMGESAKTPSDWAWESLSYLTHPAVASTGGDQMMQQQQQMVIKNLDQLKRINQEKEEEEEKEKGRSGTEGRRHGDASEDGQKDEGASDEKNAIGNNVFEIVVLDPSEALDSAVVVADNLVEQQQQAQQNEQQQHPIPRNGLRNGLRGLSAAREEEISELIAIGTDYSIHSYGDMSDEEEDAADYANFKFMMHNKVTTIDLGDVEHADVGERGWNEEEEFTVNNIQIENENLPLTICRTNPDINIASLMDDLEKNFAGQLGEVPRTTTPNITKNLNSEPSKPATKLTQPKSNQIFCLDPLEEMDEVDRQDERREEEVLSEDFFYWDDEVEETVKNEQENGQETKGPDSPDIDVLSMDPKFEVTAPDISSLMPFSFMRSQFSDHPHGVSPVLLLQALTTSSASDGINLERLETIGDSFLKMAVTNYLYHTHTEQHEGKLSFARSKEVSNSRLFYLGRQRNIPVLMETSKFDPHVNWLPPCYASTSEFHAINPHDMADLEEESREIDQSTSVGEKSEIGDKKAEEKETTGWGILDDGHQHYKCEDGIETITFPQQTKQDIHLDLPPLPYNMLTQQWISDKSIADAVEALIGAHLIQLGPEATLKFMHWLGIRVLTEPPNPTENLILDDSSKNSLILLYNKFDFGTIEHTLGYKFANKGLLIQAFTHASYFNNRVTGCYQRLEFLGDAILDYLITRFLFEHRKQYSPGVLTDLRSALVNNTIFASLAVKYNFHKHFMMLCPPLFQMIEKFVNFCKQKDFLHCANFDDEIFMVTEDEIDEGHEEDVEVPKAMGDIFESVAGAVYLDCGMELDIVWRVFYGLMRTVIEKCCANPPQSPVRELFERKNCKAKFAKLERKLETGKVRVTVTVNDKLQFTGMGRSYRIAKCTAAKRALQHLRKLDAEKKRREAEKKTAAQ